MVKQKGSGRAVGQPQLSQKGSQWRIGKTIAIFIALIMTTLFGIRRFLSSGQPRPQYKQTAETIGVTASPIVYPLWPGDIVIDIFVYIAPHASISSPGDMPRESLLVHERSFHLDRTSGDEREVHAQFEIPTVVQQQRNTHLWAHIYVAKHGAELDPSHPQYDSTAIYTITRPLTRYLPRTPPRKTVRKGKYLLSSQVATDEAQDLGEQEIKATRRSVAKYCYSDFTLSFITNTAETSWDALNPAVQQHYQLNNSLNAVEDLYGVYFYPILYLNTFWQPRSHMLELNDTNRIDQLNMNIQISTLGNWQFKIMALIDETMTRMARRASRGQNTLGDGTEFELFKEILLEQNPWLLLGTAIVSLLHMTFGFLANKSHTRYPRDRKDNAMRSSNFPLLARIVLGNVTAQIIVFLYLLDNNEATFWTTLFSQGFGIVTKASRTRKTVNRYSQRLQARSDYEHKARGSLRGDDTYKKTTIQYVEDATAPLLIVYAVYSLIYEAYKSWYSFIVTILVSSVYSYESLTMVCYSLEGKHNCIREILLLKTL